MPNLRFLPDHKPTLHRVRLAAGAGVLPRGMVLGWLAGSGTHTGASPGIGDLTGNHLFVPSPDGQAAKGVLYADTELDPTAEVIATVVMSDASIFDHELRYDASVASLDAKRRKQAELARCGIVVRT